MTDLKTLQTAFQDAVLGRDTDSDISAHLIGTDTMSVQERLAVYQAGYRLRLVALLVSIYPHLHAWWGAEAFEHAAAAYVEQHPSQHFSLYRFPQYFLEFLEKTVPDHPEYGALAAFEQALDDVLRVADTATLDITVLQNLPPEEWPGLRLVLHPSVRICTLAWNTVAVWEALSEGAETVPEPVRSAEPVSWVVWYHQRQAYYVALSVPEAIMLRAIAEGADFSECCTQLCAELAESAVPEFAAGTLVRWVELGFFAEQGAE